MKLEMLCADELKTINGGFTPVPATDGDMENTTGVTQSANQISTPGDLAQTRHSSNMIFGINLFGM